MTTPASAPSETRKRYRPYVPENMEMPEFTLRAVLLGLVMTVILGAANAYLGLRAGITIAATYPDRKSTRLNSSHGYISYAVFCLKKKHMSITALHLVPC